MEQLHGLNDATWRLGTSDLQPTLERGVEKNAMLEEAARFGYAIMEKLATVAVDAGLPMKLDY